VGPFPGDSGVSGFDGIVEYIEGVQDRVLDYFTTNEYRSAMPGYAQMEGDNQRVVEKPEELILAETLIATGQTFLSGGYVDQPWIIMKVCETALTAKALYRNSVTRRQSDSAAGAD